MRAIAGDYAGAKELLKPGEGLPAGSDGGLQFRYIAVSDAGSAERIGWINGLGAGYRQFDFGSNPDILTSRAEPEFDFVVFGGEDAHRLARFMRAHGRMLHDKPKLCVCLRSQPEHRARLLSAGFDDVADMRRVGQQEFMARVQAILKRYSAANAQRRRELLQATRLEQVCSVAALSARQRAIVWSLLEAPGAIATGYALRLAGSREGEEMSPESLKTMISCIRKALRPGYQIVAEAPAMYRLVRSVPVQPRQPTFQTGS